MPKLIPASTQKHSAHDNFKPCQAVMRSENRVMLFSLSELCGHTV